MKQRTIFTLLALMFSACSTSPDNVGPTPEEVELPNETMQLERTPFYYTNPESRTPLHSVASEEHRLSFFGWGESTDKQFQMALPDDTSEVDRVLLEYRMGLWGNMPGEWDNTTMLFVEDKTSGERYEIARAITPYGNGFGKYWQKKFWLDVTEYLPMLSGNTTFYLYYGGWDAKDNRGHTVTATLHYYKGTPKRNVVFTHELYDSSKDGNSGYRGWAYGVEGHHIEDATRLGERVVDIPKEVKSLEMRVAITGHGHDQGTFVERPGYRTLNAAEFDDNYYEVVVNGEAAAKKGHIFYSNADTYKQAGTYLYDRANWGPGLPINVQYWKIKRPENGFGKLSIDLNLEEFKSEMTEPNAEGVAQYIIQVNLFGYDK